VHNLSTTFVLGYHGCDRETGERLLLNEAFQPSENAYDWLGSGIYFWEANPDRALEWAHERADRILKDEGRKLEPFVVGAAIDLGFCLDLISSNGIHAVEEAYISFQSIVAASGAQMRSFMCEDALALYRDFKSRGVHARNRPSVGNGLWVVPLTHPDGYRTASS
jgi:hypothetical protein